DPVAPLVEDRLGPVPVAAAPRALEATVAEPVEIGEDAILVFQHSSGLDPSGRKARVGLPVLGSAAAGGQFGRLSHPLLAIDATGKRKIGSHPADLASHPRGDLIEVKDAEFVQALLVDRAHALDPLQIVGPGPSRSVEGGRTNADSVSLLPGRGVR